MSNIFWSATIKNSVAIVCWTFLAWHFDKWWIALFGVLFMTSTEWKHTERKDNE